MARSIIEYHALILPSMAFSNHNTFFHELRHRFIKALESIKEDWHTTTTIESRRALMCPFLFGKGTVASIALGLGSLKSQKELSGAGQGIPSIGMAF